MLSAVFPCPKVVPSVLWRPHDMHVVMLFGVGAMALPFALALFRRFACRLADSGRELSGAPRASAKQLQEPAKPDEVKTDLGFILIDADNVRAALGWPPREALRRRVVQWSRAQAEPTAMILASDGGGLSAMLISPSVVQTTSGRWRADDTIVRDVRWLVAEGQRELTIVTSDKLLRKRCRAAAGQRLRLRFEASEAFAGWLPSVGQDLLPLAGSTTSMSDPCQPRLREFLEWVVAERPRPTTADHERSACPGVRLRGRKM